MDPKASQPSTLSGRKNGRSERRMGKGKIRGKSLLMLFCSYSVSLPRGDVDPPKITEVKSMRETSSSPIDN